MEEVGQTTQLRAGELIIIVVVLIMWAGEDLNVYLTRIRLLHTQRFCRNLTQNNKSPAVAYKSRCIHLCLEINQRWLIMNTFCLFS